MVSLIEMVDCGNAEGVQEAIKERKASQGHHWQFIDTIFQDAAARSIIRKDRKIVQIFLDEGICPSSIVKIERDNKSFLEIAASIGDLEMVKLLVSRHAGYYDNKGEKHYHALRVAVEKGKVEIAKVLLEDGANANSSYGGLYPSPTFLGMAAFLGLKEMVDLLVHHGADVGIAIKLNYLHFMEILSCNKLHPLKPLGFHQEIQPHQVKEEVEKYKASVRLLHEYAQEVDWKEDEAKHLAYQDLSGINLVGVSIEGKPITRELLVQNGYQGADKAIVTLPDVENLETTRREFLLGRLKKAIERCGLCISKDGVVNLVPIISAAIHGDSEIVKIRLVNGADPNTCNMFRECLIKLAVTNGQEEIALILAGHEKINKASVVSAADLAEQCFKPELAIALRSKLQTDQKDENGNTALHNAAYEGYLPKVKALISNGANVELTNSENITPLNIAFQNGHVAVAEYLLPLSLKQPIEKIARKEGQEAEFVPWYTSYIFIAFKSKNWKPLIELLIAHGANLNASYWEPLLNKQIGDFPKFSSVGTNILLRTAYGSIRDGKDDDDKKRLTEEAQNEIIESQKKRIEWAKERLTFLLERGANPALKDYQGKTALISFVERSDLAYYKDTVERVIEQYLAHGAPIDEADNEGYTALHYAAKRNYYPAVECLLRHKANPNIQNKLGQIPIVLLDSRNQETFKSML